MKETTFRNVTVTVSASSAKEAYAMLCDALHSIHAEWSTDTYTTDDQTELRWTSELWRLSAGKPR